MKRSTNWAVAGATLAVLTIGAAGVRRAAGQANRVAETLPNRYPNFESGREETIEQEIARNAGAYMVVKVRLSFYDGKQEHTDYLEYVCDFAGTRGYNLVEVTPQYQTDQTARGLLSEVVGYTLFFHRDAASPD